MTGHSGGSAFTVSKGEGVAEVQPGALQGTRRTRARTSSTGTAATVAASQAARGTTSSGSAEAVEGYVTAFWWGAGIFAVGALVCGGLLRSDVRPEMGHGAAEPAAA